MLRVLSINFCSVAVRIDFCGAEAEHEVRQPTEDQYRCDSCAVWALVGACWLGAGSPDWLGGAAFWLPWDWRLAGSVRNDPGPDQQRKMSCQWAIQWCVVLWGTRPELCRKLLAGRAVSLEAAGFLGRAQGRCWPATGPSWRAYSRLDAPLL